MAQVLIRVPVRSLCRRTRQHATDKREEKHASQRTEGHRLDKQPQPWEPVVAGSSPAPRASKEADGRALAQLSRCSPPISATVHNAPHGVTVPALEGTSGERWHRSFWDACLPTSATGRPIADYRRRPPCVSNSEHEPGGRDPFRRGRRERSRRSRCRRSATIWSHRTLPFFAESTGGRSMDEIKGIARVKIHPGKLDEWKRLTEQAMEIVRTRDRGTLQYEVFFTTTRARRSSSSGTETPTLRWSISPTSATSWNRSWPPPPSPARSSAPRTRRCEHSSATANRNSLPRGWPHTTRRHHAPNAS